MKQDWREKLPMLRQILVRVLVILECVFAVGSVAYIAYMQLVPVKYTIILAVLLALVIGLQIWLFIRFERAKWAKIISVVLSVVILSVTLFGTSVLHTVYRSLIQLPDPEAEVDSVQVEVRKEPFLIYLSGVDTRNSETIVEKGLSDVNMVIAVNPKTNKILMINVPRDYYLPLYGNLEKMDKLTHAGSQGIACSMETLGACFDVQFNYYVRVNFHSVVEIVDAIGGITVDSQYAFSSEYSLSGETYQFVKGKNDLTGDAALAFARERHSFASGDLQRGINQQLVIKAILNKVTSPAILQPGKINTLLNVLVSHTKTNISLDEIRTLINYQLDELPGWDVQSMSVTGKGASRPCYLAGSQNLSVILPDDASVLAATQAINEVMGK